MVAKRQTDTLGFVRIWCLDLLLLDEDFCLTSFPLIIFPAYSSHSQTADFSSQWPYISSYNRFSCQFLAGRPTGAGALPSLILKSKPGRLLGPLLGGAAGAMLSSSVMKWFLKYMYLADHSGHFGHHCSFFYHNFTGQCAVIALPLSRAAIHVALDFRSIFV